ncbi:MAG TPA: DUF423 domain-containing protein [Chitinophagaceae bacterium]|nr:DUF423 domain-containing protein [Chitinophagaceae bacterium]
MHRNYFITAAVLGALGVALGAFGAHGLQQLTTDEKILHSYQTGVQYQVYHSIALLIAAAVAEKLNEKYFKWAALCFTVGVIFFSGSLYIITYLKIQESDAARYLGPVTPLGGLLFIAGWLLLAVSALKKQNS